MAKTKIESLTFRELMEYDTATRQLITEYSSMARKYDGSFSSSGEEVLMVEKYSKLHDVLKFEIMKRLDNLE